MSAREILSLLGVDLETGLDPSLPTSKDIEKVELRQSKPGLYPKDVRTMQAQACATIEYLFDAIDSRDKDVFRVAQEADRLATDNKNLRAEIDLMNARGVELSAEAVAQATGTKNAEDAEKIASLSAALLETEQYVKTLESKVKELEKTVEEQGTNSAAMGGLELENKHLREENKELLEWAEDARQKYAEMEEALAKYESSNSPNILSQLQSELAKSKAEAETAKAESMEAIKAASREVAELRMQVSELQDDSSDGSIHETASVPKSVPEPVSYMPKPKQTRPMPDLNEPKPQSHMMPSVDTGSKKMPTVTPQHHEQQLPPHPVSKMPDVEDDESGDIGKDNMYGHHVGKYRNSKNPPSPKELGADLDLSVIDEVLNM